MRSTWATVVPAWIASITTGCSLLLALYILLRDRRRAEQAQAELIGFYYETSMYGSKVTIHNSSTLDITSITIDVRYKKPKRFNNPVRAWQENDVSHFPVLEPGQREVAEYNLLRSYQGQEVKRIRLMFVDGKGIAWTRKDVGKRLRRGFHYERPHRTWRYRMRIITGLDFIWRMRHRAK